ncbi:D-alanyl-D-alanine carboxypeptidase [Herbiconiux sp.]|uniref:D-alanyl-D-alanine carboxypeptidase family protein n=1 Tax=Herbiconiux sp. TaxID=1871186 RepID=UPI0025C037D6|nr:D-alanyl-D-alanine carboxypeptidase [Herbiconiux sp.]
MKSARTVRVRPAAIGLAGLAVLVVVGGIAGYAAGVGGSGNGSGAPATAVASTDATAIATATAAMPDIAGGTAAALEFPVVGSGAVGIAHDDGTVEVLGQGGETGTVPIASITKVITSLVVLDAHPLADAADPGPTITLGQADLDITAEVEAEDQFTEPMYAGQQVTLRDALAITLLTSANNYAESVALWAFGSQEAYLEAARSWLSEHGLDATTLADASGLDPGSASSSADLLRVAALAHADPALLSIAGTASLDQADLGTIANQNILLGENGVDGLKTGSTSYAGFTLLTSAVVTVGATPVTLVSVVLGTRSLEARFADTRALLASAQAGLREVPLATAGQAFGSFSTGSDAAAVAAVAGSDVRAVVFGDTPVRAEAEFAEVRAGAPAGTEAGVVRFTVGSARYEVPLVLESALAAS